MSTWRDEYTPVSPEVTLHTRLRNSSNPSPFPTLLLLHFWGGSNETYEPLASSLDERINLIIPSLRGWGSSTKVSDPEAYHAADYAGDISSLVDKFSNSHPALFQHGLILAGHSLGGKIALKIVAESSIAPEMLRGLVLIAPSPASGMIFPSAMLAKMRTAFSTYASAHDVVKTAMLGKKAAGDEELVTKLANDAARGCFEAASAFPDYGAKEDFEKELMTAVEKRVNDGKGLEVLVLEGDERLEDAEGKVMDVLKEAGAKARYERLACGHLIPVEAPEELARMIEEFVSERCDGHN